MPFVSINNIKCIVPALVLIIICCMGCKKLVHVDPPGNRLVAGTVFSNDSMAQATVNGIYIKVMGSSKYLLNGAMSLYPALSADELVPTTASLLAENEFALNALLSNNPLINTNIWKAAYAYIYQCNICVEGLQKSTAVSAAVKNRLLGEVLFVRALCYYYLVNLYGDVPLVLSTNAEVNAILPRSAVAKVYEQMVNDLQSAASLLTADADNTVPSHFAAQALLARVYLYKGNLNEAESAASTVIGSGRYSLENDLNNVFLSASSEIIFQWAPVLPNFNTVEGNSFIPVSGTAAPAYAITNGLLAAFESGDLRKSNWIKEANTGSVTWYYPSKYKVRTSPVATEYNVVLRLAELYLIRADARAQQNKIGEAVADINVIRARAGLPLLLSSISDEQCLLAIEQERRTELFTEWGHRWFDLKRSNRANAVLSVVKGTNWQTTDHLYPIPLSEIESGPNLVQNPGYK